MALHATITTGEVHIPYNWTYASITAREAATGFIAADVGKLARQTDDNSIWMLTATTPTWIQFGGTGNAYPTDYVNGLGVNYSSASQVTIEVGECRSNDDTRNIINSAQKTVDITVSGAGGLDTGSESSDQWYAVFIIMKSSDGTVSSLLSTSATSPTMPSGYDKKKRVGWVRNDDSSNFLEFYTVGMGATKSILYDDLNTVVDGGNTATFTDVDCSAFIPSTSQRGIFHLRSEDAGSNAYSYVRRNGSSAGGFYCIGWNNVTTIGECSTDSSQYIEYRSGDTGDDTYLYVMGYYDEL